LEGTKLKDIKIKKKIQKRLGARAFNQSPHAFFLKKKEREIDDALFVFT
jgi:hypothetical protein